jgi:hypothetical protein
MFVHEAVVELFKNQLELIEQHEYYNCEDATSVPSSQPPTAVCCSSLLSTMYIYTLPVIEGL